MSVCGLGVSEHQLWAVRAACLRWSPAATGGLGALVAHASSPGAQCRTWGVARLAIEPGSDEWVAESFRVVAAALALGLAVVARELRAVEVFHGQRGAEEAGAGDPARDPEVDCAVDGQLDDVVG